MAMVRRFFDTRGLLEVDVPAMSRYASVDSYIDLIETKDGNFLHSSPEYALKRLLCNGSGDIYFLGHVYRKEEEGTLHSSEFSMIEWYRIGMDEKTFLDEVVNLLSLFLGILPVEIVDFNDAFAAHGEPIPCDIDTSTWSEEDKLFYTWASFVEPKLGRGKITIITNFPAKHAVLAKTHVVNGQEKARRYEFYYEGIELANGFDELTDPDEHARRFEEANEAREKLGKERYPIDQDFIAALKQGGLPHNCYGMAAGFDRLLMLKEKRKEIGQILPLTTFR